MKRKRLNIGLFISNEKDDFDNDLIQGAMVGAAEIDANLIIFPGRYIKGDYDDKERTRNEYMHNTLFSYVSGKHIDVLLISLGTIATTLNDREKKIFLDMFHDIPVILLASDFPGYASVNFNNDTGLRQGIEDLIVSSGCKNIGMVSGPMTNIDAIQRLNIYKETLKAHNLKVTDNQIVYGNFSEYCTNEVEELLAKNPKLDAVVFANDSMAKGGYSVFNKHGINIGSDIMVMGFDDSPTATNLMPNLSSVKAEAKELARCAVHKASTLKLGDEPQNLYIDTCFIKRASSGSDNIDILTVLEKGGINQITSRNIAKASKLITNYVFSNKKSDDDYNEFIQHINAFTSQFIKQILNEDASTNAIEKIGFNLEQALETKTGRVLEIKFMSSLLDSISSMAMFHFPESKLLISNLTYKYMSSVAMSVMVRKHKDESFKDWVIWMGTSITRDMLHYSEEDDNSYKSVNDKIIRLGISSSYLYALESPFVANGPDIWHDWRIPDTMMLKSYYRDNGKIHVLSEDKQQINSTEIFDNKYMPKDRRYTLFIRSIFINEEQLGMLVCEVEHDQIPNINTIVNELSAAYKIIYMLRAQAGIQRQLEASLQKISESNKILENISKLDELTGIYNRRGFFDISNRLVKDNKNIGKKAILIFADMDNLKLVNDQFGHDDGDYALRSVSDILQESMRASDIVARIGGDEFAIIAITEKDTDAESIRTRINTICEKFNENCSKPYYIGISVGYTEFDCSSDVSIETYMDEADRMLYQDKSNKRKDIIK